jgi:hypothetical protein
MTSDLFYSWVGEVVPQHRNKGLALELMKKQHELVTQMGYKVIRTHTENRFRTMLILSLKYGFDVVGVFKSESNGRQIIILEIELIHPLS